MKSYDNSIIIRGLKVTACHGVHGFEKREPQSFVFDAELFCDFSDTAGTDDLGDTVSYSDACSMIVRIASENSFNLIEKLAYECAYALMDAFSLNGVKVTVYKPEAPVKRDLDTVGVVVSLEREKVYLSLGSSMGDRESYIKKALEELNDTRGIRIRKVSSFIETEPYGGVAKNKFLNCAAEAETYLSPARFLKRIHEIEKDCERERDKRWDDRTLDIDIIFFGNRIICEDDLTVPHPDYANRGFVLAPLKEIAPDFVCPVLKKRVKFM